MALELTQIVSRIPLVDRKSRSPKMKRHLYKMYRQRGLTIKLSGNLAGYSESYIKGKGGCRLESQYKVSIAEALDKVGLTDDVIASEVARIAMGAKKVQGCDVYIEDDNGKWVVNQNSSDFIDVDDEKTRLEALKLASVLKKHIKVGGNSNGNGQGNQVVQVIVKFPEEVAAERAASAVEVKTERIPSEKIIVG